MEVLTTNYTQDDEIMTKISLIDCGTEVDKYILYNDGNSDAKISGDLQRTTRTIQHFIERIYDMGKKGINIEFYTREIPISEENK